MDNPPCETPAQDSFDAVKSRVLSWMLSLSVAAGETRAAEGYLLELIAWCAFSERLLVAGKQDLE